LVNRDISDITALELKVAATGLLRFQGVYGLNASEMANGKLSDKQYK